LKQVTSMTIAARVDSALARIASAAQVNKPRRVAPLTEQELRKLPSINQLEAAAALDYKTTRTIRKWRDDGRLTEANHGRVVINEKFWKLYRNRHRPIVG
jgi:hypothetical protein